ncbi:MAG TPA: STAS domain-containing protein [Acidimicrobiales bacterium]|nr:STAS domain-containing protein [Acidimicrobiales bacterium]
MDLTFEIAETRLDGVSVLTVTGEIDMATAPDLRERLVALEADRISAIVVDLTGVSFIDSTALGVLVGAYRRQEEAGGTLKLVVTEPRVRKVLEITDLTSVFPVFTSVDEAVGG